MAGGALQPQAALAQYWSYGPWYGGWGSPRPVYPRPYTPYSRGYDDEGPLRPGEAADLLRRRGWTLLSGLSRSGGNYIATVRNGYGQRMFVVLDAYDGRVLRTRMLDERPDTDSLASIPGGGGGSLPGDGIRPILPGPATPAPKAKPKGPVVKRVAPPASVKREPITPPPGSPSEPPAAPDAKGSGIAVAKPPVEPPGAKPPSPPTPTPEPSSPSAALTPPDAGSPPDGSAAKPPVAPSPPKPAAKGGKAAEPSAGDPGHPSPSVRQVYPPEGGQGAAPTPSPVPSPAQTPPPAPSASASSSALAAPAAPPAPTPAPEPAKPAPVAKPADKPSLPPDAGFE
jgi:hypothetical protein